MTNGFFTQPNKLYNGNNEVKPKTITIDARYKEMYCQSSSRDIIKEDAREKSNQQVFWNYMMNTSMQNAILQMSKRETAVVK